MKFLYLFHFLGAVLAYLDPDPRTQLSWDRILTKQYLPVMVFVQDCHAILSRHWAVIFLAGSARPDMPGASEGPAPIMRVFGITMEGNSGQDSFFIGKSFKIFLILSTKGTVPGYLPSVCVWNPVHNWIFLPWSISLTLIHIFLSWSRSYYPDPDPLSLIQIFLLWFRSSYPDPDLLTLIQIFLSWSRSS